MAQNRTLVLDPVCFDAGGGSSILYDYTLEFPDDFSFFWEGTFSSFASSDCTGAPLVSFSNVDALFANLLAKGAGRSRATSPA